MFPDKRQYTVKEMDGRTCGENGLSIPVLSYEEAADLVTGINQWRLGIQYYMKQPEPLPDKTDIEYSPSGKSIKKTANHCLHKVIL